MKSLIRKRVLSIAVSVALLQTAHAEETGAEPAVAPVATDVTAPAGAPASGETLQEVRVVASSERESVQGATGLSLGIKDTPQAVSVMDADTIDKHGLDDVNALLDMITGVNVERTETDRTYYNSRGFDLKNMQVDGVGLPLHWANVVGSIDSAIYEKVEVIRGANGLMVGTGNPSGAINFIRKRPEREYEGSVKITEGSWDRKRLEADVSTPLSENWSARLVAASQDAGSWLDSYESERSVLYGVVAGKLGESTLLTIGYTDHRSIGRGALWGALPLLDSNGDPTDYDVSASTTMDWTFYKNENRTAFVELLQDVGEGWEWKTTVTQNNYTEPSELFYVYGTPDPVTGLGLYGWPGKYHSTADRIMLDSSVSGSFDLAGRRHELTAGISVARNDSGYRSYDAPPSDPAWGALPAFPGWNGTEIARPDFGPGYVSADINEDYRRLHAAMRMAASDALQVIAGFNAIDVHSAGFSFGADAYRDEEQVSPYLGAVYALDDRTNLYASYSDIFDPQVEADIDGKLLGAAQGFSYELGLKSEWVDRRLLGTVALFRAEQENLAEVAGWDPDIGANYYRGTEVTAQGIELELAGYVTDAWKIGTGYTWLEIEDAAGNDDARPWVPRQTFKLTTGYDLLDRLEVGGTARWQDAISSTTPGIRQPAYAVFSAYASFEPAENLELSLNVDNLTDEKYLSSLYWDQSFHAEPRSVEASVKFSF